jgi:hypothetical protein
VDAVAVGDADAVVWWGVGEGFCKLLLHAELPFRVSAPGSLARRPGHTF